MDLSLSDASGLVRSCLKKASSGYLFNLSPSYKTVGVPHWFPTATQYSFELPSTDRKSSVTGLSPWESTILKKF